jgi:hypothetical protein
VIINLGSAAADDPGTDMLFGGRRVSARAADQVGRATTGSTQPSAGCPHAGAKSEPTRSAQPEQAEPLDTPGQPLHACPGREMAMGVLLGMISAVVMQKGLRRESRLLLSFDPD